MKLFLIFAALLIQCTCIYCKRDLDKRFVTLAQPPSQGGYIDLKGHDAWQDTTEFNGAPSRAFDGNTNPDYFAGASCSHTSLAGEHWLAVKFNGLVTFNNVIITNRKDCCTNRLNNFKIYTSQNDVFDPKNPFAGMDQCMSYCSTGDSPLVFDLVSNVPCTGKYGLISMNNNNNPLTVCEMQFRYLIQASSEVFIDLKGHDAWQDTTGWNGVPSRAFDGNTNPDYFAGASCSHTLEAGEHWLAVKFNGQYTFNHVRITNRKDCCTNRLNNFKVYASQSDVFDPKNPFADMDECVSFCTTGNSPLVFDLVSNVPCTGKYGMISMNNNNNPLTVCEMQFRYFSQPPAPPSINLVGHDVWQDTTEWNGAPSRAVDGNANPDYFAGASCSHTSGPGEHWLAVKLNGLYAFNNVIITNRKDCCTNRLNNFKIYASQNDVFDPKNPFAGMKECMSYSSTGDSPLVFDLVSTIPCIGEYVMVTINNNNNPLTICELQIGNK